jgi:integrase
MRVSLRVYPLNVAIMPLCDTRIRNAKAKPAPYKLTDGSGLYVEIRPTGAKLWRYRYRIAGRENVFAAGEYGQAPDSEAQRQAEARRDAGRLTLSEARLKREEWRALVKQGIHPAHHRNAERIRAGHEQANTFEAVAREWFDHNSAHWSPRTLSQRERLFERDVFPHIGPLPIAQVTAAHVLGIVKRIEARAPAFAVIAQQCIGAISRYAVSTLRADSDPAAPTRGALKPRAVSHKQPLSRSEIPEFLTKLEGFPGSFSNKVALRLVFLTLVRTTEALHARWGEFDLDAESPIWRIPAGRTKMREEHVVPLSTQAVILLKRLQAVTGSGEYLFPSRSSLRKPASIGVLWKAVVSMGYAGRFSPHGIRATGSTILNEMGFRPDVIEHQLAHKERNKVRASYNRAEYLEERRTMMQQWADLLDSLESGGNVIPLRREFA